MSNGEDFQDTDFTYRPESDVAGELSRHPKDDLPEKGSGASRETLGKYLSALTKNSVGDAGHPNAYPVEPKYVEASDVISDNTVLANAPSTFFNDMSPAMREALAMGSNSGDFDPLTDFLDKRSLGQGDVTGQPSAKSGHRLLADVSPNPISSVEPINPTVVQQKISAALKMNRFNPSGQTPYMVSGNADAPSDGFYSAQGRLGEYDPDAAGVGVGQLEKIGRALMVRSTGHNEVEGITIPNPFGADKVIPGPEMDSAWYWDMLLLPTKVQLAIPWAGKLDAGYLRAKNVKYAPKTGQASPEDPMYLSFNNDDAGQQSYGNLNNPWEPFDGAGPMSMVVLGAVCALALQGITIILDWLPGWKSLDSPEDPPDPTKLVAGSSRPLSTNVGDDYMRFLGFPDVHNDFFTCIEEGTRSFFGFDIFTFDASKLGDAATDLIMGSGYYVTICRHVFRDSEQVLNAGKELGTFKGISGTVGALLILMDAVATSATFRFLMVMASTGDIALGGYNHDETAGVDPDLFPTMPQTRIMKSRESTNDPRLVWRHASLPSTYLLPQGLLNLDWNAQEGLSGVPKHAAFMAGMLGRGEGRSAITAGKLTGLGMLEQSVAGKGNTQLDGSALDAVLESPGRLSSDLVRAVEQKLEMEYMPFYFHDLRTNEVIAMPAFLDSVSDSFSADYSSVGGIGRVDDVKHYSKTNRTIAVTFMMVSTNKQDFNVMWFNLNKLTAMVYPQWSQGTAVTGKDKHQKFIMPFSQVPTASPMIRLRIGDIVKSNYSNGALARLFGASEKDSTASNFSIQTAGAAALDEAKAAAEKEATRKRGQARQDFADEFMRLFYLPSRSVRGATKAADVEGGAPTEPAPQNKVLIKSRAFRRALPNNLDTFSNEEQSFIRKKRFRGPAKELGATVIDRKLKTKSKRVWWGPFGLDEEQAYNKDARVSEDTARDFSNPPVNKLKPGYQTKIIYWQELYYVVSFFWDFGPFAKDVQIDYPARHTEPQLRAKSAWVAAKMNDSPSGGVKIADSIGTYPTLDQFFGFGKGSNSANAIVRAFHSTKGRGLAGFITSLNMDYANATWEVADIGSRAPKMIKISLNFSPVHDIPPGLDHEGFMRAPTHPVGDIVNGTFGDPWGENIESAKLGEIKDVREKQQQEAAKIVPVT